MSRIGKLPVHLPAGVTAELLPGNVVKVKGPKGELSQKVDSAITVAIEGNEIKFTRPTDLPRHRSRSLRKPEPYKGKGIKFVGEQLRRKAGKSAGAK